MMPYSKQWIEEDDITAVADVMRSGFLTQGPTIERFEKAFAQYLGVKHVVAVASGTAAMHLAIVSLKKLWNDAPIRGFVPPMTFAATLNCFWYAGAEATFVDVDAMTGQMTPATLQAAFESELKKTSRDKNEKWIVMPVSMDGRPLDHAGLKAVADRYGATIVEDVARAVGGSYKEDNNAAASGALCGVSSTVTYKMGSCAHSFAATASFHSIKQLCLGEGGALMTNDDELAAKVRLLRSHGIVRPGRKEDPAWYYEQVDLGFHYRISDMHCALGLSQLKKLDARNERRSELARRYDEAFSKKPFAGRVWFAPTQVGHAHHLYIIHFENSKVRDAAWEFLKARGIGSQIQVPLYKFPYNEKRMGKFSLPGAEAYCEGMLFIPLFPQMTNEEQNQIVDLLSEFLTEQYALIEARFTARVEVIKPQSLANR
jgi:dTDP-4-amino-4,6-dideoxygalactose transaminase